MTNRERFLRTMNYSNPDRVPYLEEGIREDVLESWYEQGLPSNKMISDLFEFDQQLEIDIKFDPLLYLQNYPNSLNKLNILRKELERLNLSNVWSNLKGKIRIDDDKITFLKVHQGFFLSLGIHKWDDFSKAMIKLIEEPELVHEAMDLQFEYITKYVDLILHDIQIDAVIFNEPIGGNEGPLISPEMFEEFALKKYLPLLNIIDANKIETIILRSYANVKMLIPILLKYGFNCLWACESEGDTMDYSAIRREFGKDLRLIGGIDVDALRYGKEEIKTELVEKVPTLVKSGGYIPLADGRIRDNVSFENYCYYRSLLEDITKLS